MTCGDKCAMNVSSDCADTSAQICGHSEKKHGAEADRFTARAQKKVCTSTSELHFRQR